MEGREPEEEEDLMTGWVTVQGKRECQEETETEEMETPEARRIVDPVPNPPLREVAEDLRKAKWWQVSHLWLSKEEREEMEKRLEDARRAWRRREREKAGYKSKEEEMLVGWSREEETNFISENKLFSLLFYIYI